MSPASSKLRTGSRESLAVVSERGCGTNEGVREGEELGRLIHLLTNRPTYAELVLILILLIIFH
jgi:hypothetical protein